MRHRKTDAHIATIRVGVPIDPMNVATIEVAHAAINGLRAHLPAGSTVEVLNSRFGRVDAPVAAVATLFTHDPGLLKAIDNAIGDPHHLMPQTISQPGIADAMAAVRDQVTAGAMPEPEIPESLRRVPRHVPNGG